MAHGCLINHIHPASLRRRHLNYRHCRNDPFPKWPFLPQRNKNVPRCMTEVPCPQQGCDFKKLQPKNPSSDRPSIGGLQKDCRYHADDREDLRQVNDGKRCCWFPCGRTTIYAGYSMIPVKRWQCKNKNYFNSSDPHRDISKQPR